MLALIYKSKQRTKFYTCGCRTWSVPQKEEQKLKNFENKAPKGNFFAYETYKVFKGKFRLRGM
jgi:hypothetical protein